MAAASFTALLYGEYFQGLCVWSRFPEYVSVFAGSPAFGCRDVGTGNGSIQKKSD